MATLVESSEIRSIILNNREKTNFELNSLFPSVSVKKFASNRIQLEKKGFVDTLVKINKANSEISEIEEEEIERIVKNNSNLMPKELHKLYPSVSHNKFTGIRFRIFGKEYKNIRLQKSINNSLEKNNAYKNGKGAEKKDEIRDIVANYMKRLSGKVLGLPHIECLCVKKVVALNNNLSFIGVDNSDNVIKGMTATAKLHNLDLTPIKGELDDVIKDYTSDNFVAMNLDYCGYMAKQATSFKYVVDNDLIVKNGFLFLTFSNAVRRYKSGYGLLFEQLMKFNEQEKTGLTDTEFANDEFLKLVIGNKFEVVKKIPYQTGSPMIFYALKRIK